MKKAIRIGELAASCGVTPDTIRFYERKGLLPRPRRTGAGHRIYDPAAVQRVGFVRRAHGIGLSLADVQTLLRVRERGLSLCHPLAERLRARLELVERNLRSLSATRDLLAENLERCGQGTNGRCPVVEFLENGKVGRRSS